jgi:hypothetical protein
MKENNFYSDDFEELIRGKTEQYKMYPSENVWKGVHSALHTKRKWFIGSMAFLVTGILFMAGRELILPSHTTGAHKIAAAGNATADSDAIKASNPENTAHAPMAIIRPVNNAASTKHTADNDDAPEEMDPAAAGISITLSHPVLDQSDLSDWLSHVVRLPAQAPSLDVIAARTSPADNPGVTPGHGGGDDVRVVSNDDQHAAADEQTRNGDDQQADGLTARSVLESLSARGAHEGRFAHTGTALESSKTNRNIVKGQDRLPESTASATKASATEIAEKDDADRVNWLHDYAMNILESTPKSGRTFLQFSLSPTASYRTLGGSDLSPKEPVSGPSVGVPNDYMDHSAAAGFEFNGSILYRVTRNFSIKGGLQFNYTRFPLQGYYSSGNTSTLLTSYGAAIDSSFGLTNRRRHTETPATTYSDYYQVSAPIGFELRVLGNERLQLNLAATFAPTYLLTSNAYVLSQGYMEMDQSPAKYRKLNFNAGAEAFLSYRVGDIRLQIGPEFRYQLLSTYNSSEPISENVKSYGIKIGITKPLP